MIEWSVSPTIFPGFFVRWYGLWFAMGFYISWQCLLRIFLREGRTEADVSSLLNYTIIGTFLGARLGHCLLYNPDFYLNHPLELIKIWKGGLASHGGYLGLMIAFWLYLRTVPGMTMLQLLDRTGPAALLTGGFIRIGNLFNSEMIGLPTTKPWSFVFTRYDLVPRHPAMLYEAFGYLFIGVSGILYLFRGRRQLPEGRIIGLIFIFGMLWRFFCEFFKTDQAGFESGWALNMGQWLSLPFMIFGLLLVFSVPSKLGWNFLTQPRMQLKA